MTTPQHLSEPATNSGHPRFGGMSRSTWPRLRLHRDLAVKCCAQTSPADPSFYLRFRREAQNAAGLNHPAIVAVYDTGEAETPAGPLALTS